VVLSAPKIPENIFSVVSGGVEIVLINDISEIQGLDKVFRRSSLEGGMRVNDFFLLILSLLQIEGII
jgi:hypothetical protein